MLLKSPETSNNVYPSTHLRCFFQGQKLTQGQTLVLHLLVLVCCHPLRPSYRVCILINVLKSNESTYLAERLRVFNNESLIHSLLPFNSPSTCREVCVSVKFNLKDVLYITTGNRRLSRKKWPSPYPTSRFSGPKSWSSRSKTVLILWITCFGIKEYRNQKTRCSTLKSKPYYPTKVVVYREGPNGTPSLLQSMLSLYTVVLPTGSSRTK